ncbi:MAG: hypothetical protein AAF481_11235 [Acidobacteriota bacterium]
MILYAAVRATAAHCPECRKDLKALGEVIRIRAREGGLRPRVHQAAQFGLLDLSAALPFDRRRARRALDKLAALPRDKRLDRIDRARTAFRDPALVEAAIERSNAALGSSVDVAFHWLEVAQALYGRLNARPFPVSLLAALSLRLMARRANVFRVAEEYPAAESLWKRIRADCRLERVWDPTALAELASLESSLLLNLRRPGGAENRLSLAYDLYWLAGWSEGMITVSIKMGNVAFYSGKLLEAQEKASQALDLIGGEQNRQWLLASHSLALYSCSLGDYSEARRTLREIEPYYASLGTPSLEVAYEWLAARIAAGHGERETAQQGFTAARTTYLESGLAYGAALVTLDLAELHLTQGHLPAVQALAQETLTVFERQNVPSEAARAISLLSQAATAQRLTAALLARLRRGLGGQG